MTHRKSSTNWTFAIATLSIMMLIGFVSGATGQDEPNDPESLSPAFAQLPSAQNSPLPTSIAAPIKSGQLEEVSTVSGPLKVQTFANWAGYAVTGSSFTSVLGSWVVPPYHCLKTPNSESWFFVGMDGYSLSSETIENIGTASFCNGTHSEYFAWYTLGKTGVVITGFSVKTGDVISASVTYAGSEFTVEIYNITQGTFFSKSKAVSAAQRSSAEWILGRDTSLPPLMDFGKVSSGFDYTSITDTNWASDSSVSGPISDFGSKVVKITMFNSGTGITYATPTALSTDGSSFTVNWNHE